MWTALTGLAAQLLGLLRSVSELWGRERDRAAGRAERDAEALAEQVEREADNAAIMARRDSPDDAARRLRDGGY